MTETGETTAAINARGDDSAWRAVSERLSGGATLLRMPKINRFYCVDSDNQPSGPGLTIGRVRKLEREGILRWVGVDRYALAERPA